MIVAGLEFEQIVTAYDVGLYRFALSLTEDEHEARDLTQQTFLRWATKGHQLRNTEKVKSWLFTTLYREFLGANRNSRRYPHFALDLVEHELPAITPEVVDRMDAATVFEALMELEQIYRAPVLLFYVEDCPYKEIAELLRVPIGTVMSRIARGKEQLRQRLSIKSQSTSNEDPPARINAS
jgi:RNA polymerase sigma-70 factor (ECF subfamily)